MQKTFLIAFALVAAAAVASVDYLNQARIAGQSAANFGAVAYGGSIATRLGLPGRSTAEAPPADAVATATGEKPAAEKAPSTRATEGSLTAGSANCAVSGGVKRCSTAAPKADEAATEG